MQWKRLYKERNPLERGDEHSPIKKTKRERERERERERANDHSIKISLLLINERSILRLARGRVYIEFLFF